MRSTPVLHLLAGPNGAGKSTLAARVLQPVTHLPFVNADIIADQKWGAGAQSHAYEASALAAQEREELLAQRLSFITETVFSHTSKVELVSKATALGYLVHLHVVLIPEDTSVERVRFRVQRGGHPVPEEKIRQRYARLWTLVGDARLIADRTTIYDNTNATDPFRVIATYERGLLLGDADWPSWTPPELQ